MWGFLLLVVRVSALLSSKNSSVLGKNKMLLVVRNLLKGWKCDVVCLQETKLHNTSSTIVKSLWGSPYVDWIVLDAIRTTGEIDGGKKW